MRYFLIGIILLNIHNTLFSQKNDSVIINRIDFSGNHKTKDQVFYREISFNQGDTLIDFHEQINRSKKNLVNTQLFHYVKTSCVEHEKYVNVTFIVQERWYLWPVPIFEYADQNLATWIRRREIDYVNYGIILEDRNFRGLKQKLRIKLRRGIREQYALNYNVPQLSNNKKTGIYFDFSVFRQKELHERIVNQRYRDYSSSDYIYHEGRFIAGLRWRPGYYARHLFTAGFRQFNYSHKIDSLFGEPIRNRKQYLGIGYLFSFFKGDYVAYPLNGTKFRIQSELGIGKKCYAYADLHAGIHRKLAERITFSYGLNSFISMMKLYPYFVFAGPGKKWYIRGFEDYIYHHDLLLLNRLQFKYTLLPKKTFHFERIPSDRFNSPYLGIYLNIFAEAGYGTNFISDHSDNTPLSTGIGLDFLTYYDWIGRLEIVVNNENETWFNIHWGYVF